MPAEYGTGRERGREAGPWAQVQGRKEAGSGAPCSPERPHVVCPCGVSHRHVDGGGAALGGHWGVGSAPPSDPPQVLGSLTLPPAWACPGTVPSSPAGWVGRGPAVVTPLRTHSLDTHVSARSAGPRDWRRLHVPHPCILEEVCALSLAGCPWLCSGDPGQHDRRPRTSWPVLALGVGRRPPSEEEHQGDILGQLEATAWLGFLADPTRSGKVSCPGSGTGCGWLAQTEGNTVHPRSERPVSWMPAAVSQRW